ncbi:MAG: hypothetical protein ACLFVU_14505 [Phycisphaerae bacterium]
MKDPQNIMLVLLMVTSLILGAIVVTTYTTDQAYAESSTREGRYTVVSGEWSNSADLIYMVDIPAQKLNVYFIEERGQAAEMKKVETVNLKRLFP